MDSIREFMVSSSGLAPVRRGLGLGWVISALTGVAILLGARGAEANACPTSRDCKFDEDCPSETPIEYCTTWRSPTKNGGCKITGYSCVCTL